MRIRRELGTQLAAAFGFLSDQGLAGSAQDETAARAIKVTKTLKGARCEYSRLRRTLSNAAATVAAPSTIPATGLTENAIIAALTISTPPATMPHQGG